MHRPTTRLATATACLTLTCGLSQAQRYTITDLGVLPGHQQSWATSVNDSGDVVGHSHDVTTNTRHAFLHNGGTLIDLGTLPGGRFAWAYGINSFGEIVGESDEPFGLGSIYHGFYLNGGTMTPLFSVSTSGSRARDINDGGMIVGRSFFPNTATNTAAVWTSAGIIDLGSIVPGSSEAFGVNNNDWVVGHATVFDGFSWWTQAFVWTGGPMTGLGTLGSPSAYSRANDVNDLNQVVGWSDGLGPQTRHAFLWDGGVMTDLGTLGPNWTLSEARAINDSGEIVGAGNTASLNSHAILWRKGKVHDLNDLVLPTGHGWELVTAEDVSNTGYIVGTGYPPGGQHLHAYRLRKLDFGNLQKRKLPPQPVMSLP